MEQREYDPQEIEFTFESPAGDDLFLLQKRPMIQNAGEERPVFDMRGCDSCELPLAVGVGVSGGAYAGRVAIDEAQIDAAAGGGSRTAQSSSSGRTRCPRTSP